MRVNHFGTLLALVTLLVSIVGFRWHQKKLDQVSATDIQIEKLPYQIGDWKGEDTKGLDVRSQEVLQLDRYIKRRYVNSDGDYLLLYIGYWKRQSGEYQAAKHSPLLCLPSNGWHVQPRKTKTLAVSSSNDTFRVKRLVGELREDDWLFYYWFFTGETDYTQEWKALIEISLQSLFTGRTDGGIVEISMPIRGEKGYADNLQDREQLIENFLKSFYPELNRLLEQDAR